MNRVPRLLLAAVTGALVLPAAAAAATITVSPGEDPQAKVASAAAGDTVLFKSGTHTGAISTATANLTLRGEPGAVLAAPASATDATPTIAFTAESGGADVVDGLTVVNQAGTGPVVSGGAAGLTVRDSLLLSSAGNGLRFGGAANLLQRATVVTLLKTGTAVTIDSSTAEAAKTLTVDSSVLVGQKSLTSAYASPTVAGAGITVAARHVTAIGAVVADATGAPTLGASPIALTFTDSIVRGVRVAAASAETAGATITAAPDRNSLADSTGDIGSLFVNPASFNYHLRADAAVLDKGQLTAGESATDVDGDPRTSGAASDYGADEFVNRAPSAAVDARAGSVRQNAAATFDASKSSDPEGRIGGGIARYHWDFGDGQTADTTTPTTTHAYSQRRSYAVTVTVVDKQGAASAPSPTVAVDVIDGIPPAVTVAQPTRKQKVRIYRRGQRTKVTFFGTATDDLAMGKVLLALRPVKLAGGRCRWFDGKRRLRPGACTVPVLLAPAMSAGGWRYGLPLRARLPRGAYRLVAVAIDASGLSSVVRTVDFRLR